MSATSDSGDPVTFSLDKTTTRNACSLSGSTVTFAHAGRCMLDADQAGDADYQAAPTATQAFDVPKAAQKISLHLHAAGVAEGRRVLPGERQRR